MSTEEQFSLALESYRERLLATHRELIAERSRKYYWSHLGKMRKRGRRRGKEQYQKRKQYYKEYHVRYYALYKEFILRKKKVSEIRKRRIAEEERIGAWECRKNLDDEALLQIDAGKRALFGEECLDFPRVARRFDLQNALRWRRTRT